MNKREIDKNVKDLEYQHLLNMQNIILGFIGAAIITVLFLQSLPTNWPNKENTIFLLFFLALFFFLYFRKELRKKLESIKSLKT